MVAWVVGVVLLVGLGVYVWERVTDEPDVLLVGDSILRQTGGVLPDELPDYEVANRAVNGSGLLNPAVYDWVERLPGLLAQHQPEKTVVLFIGNYAPEDQWWIGPDGKPVRPDSPQFFAEWRAQSEKIVTELEASGTEIYWVLPPPVGNDAGNETIIGLREVYRDLAEDHPSVTLVDAAPSLTDGTGEFVGSVSDEDGDTLVLRVADGVHLGEEGARRMAAVIAEAVLAAA